MYLESNKAVPDTIILPKVIVTENYTRQSSGLDNPQYAYCWVLMLVYVGWVI